MSWSVMGRFFGVPLLIIGTIVGGAILVVLLFGGPAAPQQRSIEAILTALESSGGERSAGVLLPREKELWQMALELSARLERKDAELTGEDLTKAAERIAAMVRSELSGAERLGGPPEDIQAQRDLRSKRFEFLIHALGRTGRPEVVEPLAEVVSSGREPYVRAAMQELGNLHALPESKRAVKAIVASMDESKTPETVMVACTALSVLADRADERTRNAIKEVMYARDGEVSWSAALALGRLGDGSGRSVLLDMLDRSFWEKGERYQVRESGGEIHRYPMPPQRVEAMLAASIDAASNLEDPALWEAIDRLKSDPSSSVRAKADAARREVTSMPGGE